MAWFRKEKKKLTAQPKKSIPDGVWLKCEQCGQISYRQELFRNMWVCSKCQFHFSIPCETYINILLDKDSFIEHNAHLRSRDPLHFKDSKKYSDRIKQTMSKTGRNEAIITGEGKINSKPVSIGIMDFNFIGGSMGSVVGEKVARIAHRSLEKHEPLIIISRSGGARMQEGVLSLMQMAKTSAVLGQLSETRIPYISILANPTTGGVTASFSFLGDIILAEPKALIGFAGPRVIRQTIGQDLPEGFQRAEFLLEHGMIDRIVKRSELKETVSKLLDFLTPTNENER